MKLVAYVDGSFDKDQGRYGFGCVLITPEGEIVKENGSGDNAEAAAIWNIAGELLGAMYATKWAIKREYSHIEIFHDYEGIAKWVTAEWKAKNDMVKQYVQQMNKFKQYIEISFVKVKGHSNDQYNDMADGLAKEAVRTGKKNKTV